MRLFHRLGCCFEDGIDGWNLFYLSLAAVLTWAYPDFGAAGLALLLALGLLLAHAARTRRLGRVLGRGVRQLGWKLPLRLLAGGLLLLALLGPSYGVSQRPVRTAGKDVWLVVDVSRSMDAPDVAPTRLLRTQAELRILAAGFPADRLGVVVFGGTAVVQCPLTYDQEAVQVFINTLRTRLLPAGPTALRLPLDLLVDRQTPAAGTAPTAPRTTAVVLVSDGEDFGENLEPAVQALARTGTRIYAVGVGTAVGAKIPVARGGFVKDGRGQVVHTRLQDATLRQLARQTGGQYLELNNQRNGFGALLPVLRGLQGPAEQVRTVAVADNRYRWPLLAALLLLGLDAVLTIYVIRP